MRFDRTIERVAPRWTLVLALAVAAAVGIQVYEPAYNKLQTAPDAAAFLQALGHPARAIAAAACDMAFAAAYGVLGLIGMRAVAAHRNAARVGAALIVASALFDELENGLLVNNVVHRASLTTGWIVAMRVPGTLKWIGSPVFFVVLVTLISREIRSLRSR